MLCACGELATHVCWDCQHTFYCSENCQDEEIGSHMLICAQAFDDRMRKKWRSPLKKLADLVNRERGATLRSYDDLVRHFLGENSIHTTTLRLKAIDSWVSNKPDDEKMVQMKIWDYEDKTIRKMAEVFQVVIEDSLIPAGPETEIKKADLKFILDKILPLVLSILKKACETSSKFRDMPFCPSVKKLRADLAKAKKGSERAPTGPVKLPKAKPRKELNLNDLWDEKCSGVKAPWYGNAFHLMGANFAIGEFLCNLALAPMSNEELDVMLMVLETLNQTPGKGILSAILPSDIQSMLDRRRRKETLGLIEFESIFSKLMKIPGGMRFINSSKGMTSYGLSTAEVTNVPPPAEQLPRKLDFDLWIDNNCSGVPDIEKSAICLMQKGYKIGEFLCRLRLIPLQNTTSDLLLNIFNGTQDYANTLSSFKLLEAPVKLGLNVVLSQGNYAKRRLGQAQPPLDTFQDIAPLFEKLRSLSLMWLVSGKYGILPYGLKS